MRPIWVLSALLFFVGTPTLPTPADPSNALTLDEVLQRNLKALGGAEALAAIKSYRMQGEAEIQNVPPMPITVEWKRPNKIRIETSAKDFRTTQGYDGKKAWIESTQARLLEDSNIPAKQRAQIVRAATETLVPLSEARARGFKLELLAEDEALGKPPIRVRLTRSDGSQDLVTVDPVTYLESARETVTSVNGEEYETLTEFSNYREVQGVRQPFLIKSRPKGAETGMEIRVSSFVVNPDIQDSRFAPPE